jgi:hypothetical protein
VCFCAQVTLSLISAGATLFNCLIYSILAFYTPQDVLTKLVDDPLARLPDALPIALGASTATIDEEGIKLCPPLCQATRETSMHSGQVVLGKSDNVAVI